jgi:hypothetical protein
LLATDGAQAISGDRPGLLNSSTLVPRGYMQLEVGFSRDHVRDTSDTSAFPTALRYGLSDELELRASANGWNRIDAHGAPDDEGFGPLTLGVKGPIARDWADLDLRWADSVAWVAELRMPGSALADEPNSFSPSISAVASWTPGRGPWQAGGQIGMAYEPDEATMVLDFAASASRPIGGTTSVYVETGWFPRTNGGPDPLVVGAGLIALASLDVQLDIGVDVGLGETSGDWSAGVGLCWRW